MLLDRLKNDRAPVTLTLSGLVVAAALIAFFTRGASTVALAFSIEWLKQPWTILTYPFASQGLLSVWSVISLFFLVGWLIFTGAELERAYGSKTLALLWLAFTVLPALILYGAMLALGKGDFVLGTILPLSALSVMWATRNRTMRVMLYGIIPLSGQILGWLVALIVLVTYGSTSPMLGLAAMLHLGLANLLADGKVPGVSLTAVNQAYKPSKAQIEKEERELADVARRRAERAEKDRLRDLFERSGIEDR